MAQVFFWHSLSSGPKPKGSRSVPPNSHGYAEGGHVVHGLHEHHQLAPQCGHEAHQLEHPQQPEGAQHRQPAVRLPDDLPHAGGRGWGGWAALGWPTPALTLGHSLPRGRNDSLEPPRPLLNPTWEQVRLHQSIGGAEGWWCLWRLDWAPFQCAWLVCSP